MNMLKGSSKLVCECLTEIHPTMFHYVVSSFAGCSWNSVCSVKLPAFALFLVVVICPLTRARGNYLRRPGNQDIMKNHQIRVDFSK